MSFWVGGDEGESMKRKKWYFVVITAVVAALCVQGIFIHFARQAERERALIYQLQQLRTAVVLYMKANQEKPADLVSAIETEYRFGQPIDWSFKLDSVGNPVDPFGNLYQYDSGTGWVSSGTESYQNSW